MNNSSHVNDSSCFLEERLENEWLIVVIVLGTLIFLASILGNSIIVASYAKVKSLHKSSNVLLISIVWGDILSCIIGFPTYILPDFFTYLNCSRNFMKLKVFVLVFSINVSLSSISVVAVERFIGIQFPYFYHALITIRKCTIAAVGSWLLSFLRALVMGICYGDDWCFAFSLAEYALDIVMLVCTLVVYCRVFHVSRGHIKKDRKLGVHVTHSKCIAAVMTGAVFAVSWLPPAIVRGLNLYIDNVGVFIRLTFLSPFVGTCFNLFIYTYRMEDFREAVKTFLQIGRKKTARRPDPEQPVTQPDHN